MTYEEFVTTRLPGPDRYVRRLITNTYIDQRRLSWFRKVMLRAEPAEPTPVPDHADTTADHDLLWAMLATLPRQQRAALVLRYYESLRDSEIAEVLGCSVGTVRGYISRALAAAVTRRRRLRRGLVGGTAVALVALIATVFVRLDAVRTAPEVAASAVASVVAPAGR